MARKPQDPEPIETRIGILLGWRCWVVFPQEGLLRPIYRVGLVWKPRQPMEAVCPDKLHQVPDESCHCGVWAVCHPMLLHETSWATSPPRDVDQRPGGIVVVGQVALWGSVIEHERGWRASHAYPTQLYAFTGDALLAQTLRERYVVPVAFGEQAELLRTVLPKVFESLLPPRQASGPRPVAAVASGTGHLESLGILQMVRTHEAERLERLRQDVSRVQAQMAQDRTDLEEERRAVEQLRAIQQEEQAQLAAARRALSCSRRDLEIARRRFSAKQERLHLQLRFPAPPAPPREYPQLTALKAQLRARRITQDQVAAAAGVSRTLVCHVLRGRALSQNVLTAIKRLLGEGGSAALTQPTASR